MDKFNHTCVNPNCPNKIVGADGRPQNNYYACDECDRNRGITWRSLCCTKECFEEYMSIFFDNKEKKEVKKTQPTETATKKSQPRKKNNTKKK